MRRQAGDRAPVRVVLAFGGQGVRGGVGAEGILRGAGVAAAGTHSGDTVVDQVHFGAKLIIEPVPVGSSLGPAHVLRNAERTSGKIIRVNYPRG